MKRILYFGWWLALSASFHACIPSLQPFYTEEVCTYSEALVGLWASEKADSSQILSLFDDSVWEIAGGDEQRYRIRVTTEGQTGTLAGQLFRIGGHLLLDTHPLTATSDPREAPCLDDMSEFHLLPVHHLWRVRMADQRLYLDLLNPDAVDARDQSVLTAPIGTRERIFTASSEALVQWLHLHVDDPDMWEEAVVLVRRQDDMAH